MAVIRALGLRDPAGVDAPAGRVTEFTLRRAKRVEDLDLVVAHQIDAGVRVLRHTELELKLAASIFDHRMEVRRASRVAVDEYAPAWDQRELSGIIRAQ